MSEMQNVGTDYEKLFRNAAFGGFNKQDVLNYIERMVRNRKKDNEKFQESLKAAESESGALRTQLSAANTERENLRQNLSDAQELLTKLQMENEALSGYNETMKEETQQANEKITALEKQVSDGASADAALQQAKKENGDLVSKLNSAKAELDKSRHAAETFKANAERELQHLREEMKDVSSKLSEKDTVIEELRASLAEAQVQPKDEPAVQSTSAQTTADKVIIATLEARNNDLSARVSELEEKIRRNETEKLRLTAIEDSAYAKAKKIEQEAYAKANEVAGKIAEMCTELSRAQAALESESAKTSAQYASLIEQAELLRKTLEQ